MHNTIINFWFKIVEKIKSIFLNRDLLYGVLVKIAIISTQFLLVPLFIKTVGVIHYGEWLIITTVPNYLMLSDMGLTMTVTNELAKLRYQGQIKQLHILLRSTNSFILMLGTLLIFVTFGILYLVDVQQKMGVKTFYAEELVFILMSFVISVVLTLLYNFNVEFFKALDKYYLNQKFIFYLYTADLVTTIIVLLFLKDLKFIPLCFIFNRCFLLFIVSFTLRKYQEYILGLHPDIKPTIKVLPSALSYSFYSIGFSLILQGNTLVVGKTLGASSVVIFNTIRTLLNSIRTFLSIIYLPTLPKYSKYINSKEFPSATKLYKKTILIVFCVAIALSGVFYLMKDLIFNLWVGKAFRVPELFFILMLIASTLHTVWNAKSMLPLSINKTKLLALFPILGAVGIGVQYIYLPVHGIIISSYTILVVDIVMFFLVSYQIRKILSNS